MPEHNPMRDGPPGGRRPPVRVAVDIGGTFTDLVLRRADGSLVTHKVSTTTGKPEVGFVTGVREILAKAGMAGSDVEQVVHGTTLGSNVVIERAGAPTALLTTEGFRDVLEIQRSLRHSMYDVHLQKPRPLIPRSRVWEVSERIMADGSVHRALDEAGTRAVAREIRAAGIAAVAVGFIHAYVNPAHEQRCRELLVDEVPGLMVTLSSEVSLQGREYERLNTAAANAYLIPIFREYLGEAAEALAAAGVRAPILVMQSNGGLASVSTTVHRPVRTVESGPAAGVLMAARQGRASSRANIVSFDMGGTTAKVAIIRDGLPSFGRSFEIDRREMRYGSGLPLDIPAVDLVEIGAGGGSIATASAGVIRVGPRSASAVPGPVCYGRGGTEPTITDANVVLGYLNPDYFAGGTITLDGPGATRAMAGLGAGLSLDAVTAAWGVYQTATLEMERAARLAFLHRGLDPRDFSMVCFGGAGPLHGCYLARSLGIRTVVLPANAGVGSAVGLVHAEVSTEVSRTRIIDLDSAGSDEQVEGAFADLRELAVRAVAEWSAEPGDLRFQYSVGVRYRGQSHELEVRLPDGPVTAQELARHFAKDYEETYGYREEGRTEAGTWYCTVSPRRAAGEPVTAGEEAVNRARTEPRIRRAYFPDRGMASVRTYRRDELGVGQSVEGPCVVEERDTTVVLFSGDVATPASDGSLTIKIGGEWS